MLTVRLGGFNNLVLVVPVPTAATNRHERRKTKKIETARRSK